MKRYEEKVVTVLDDPHEMAWVCHRYEKKGWSPTTYSKVPNVSPPSVRITLRRPVEKPGT